MNETADDLRCPWAIKYGVTLATRCFKNVGHHDDVNDSTHVGRGLLLYPDQTIRWLHGDTRQFQSKVTYDHSYHIDHEEIGDGPEV